MSSRGQNQLYQVSGDAFNGFDLPFSPRFELPPLKGARYATVPPVIGLEDYASACAASNWPTTR